MTAGQNLEQSREESPTGLLTPKQVAANTAAGAITGAISLGSGRVARRLGIGDIETVLAEGKSGMLMQTADDMAKAATNPETVAAMTKSMPRKMVEGFLTEGLLEELPQQFVGRVRDDVRRRLDDIRDFLAQPQKYMHRNNKAASTGRLAEFDVIAQRIVNGEALAT